VLHLVTAVVKPHKLDDVVDAAKGMGVSGLTVGEVQGFGRQGGHSETYRGAEYQVGFVPKVKVEILCETGDAETIAAGIARAAETGRVGDGKVWVTAVDRAQRIRTGEMGADAV